ncbi:MAG: hypothetical protein H6704_18115 [Myxococcales bacterium]|nr:hypothetical protein [Myxococcales bacterium]
MGLPARRADAARRITDAAFAAKAGHHAESVAGWRLHVDRRLGDVAGAIWLPGEAPRTPAPRQARTLAPVIAPIDARFPDAKPDARPAPDPLALEVADAWSIEPPRLPAGAPKDALHLEWARLDDAVLRRARDAVDALAADAPGVARALLDRLTGRQALERQRRVLLDEAKALAEVAPSERPDEAAARCQRLMALGADVEAWRRARGRPSTRHASVRRTRRQSRRRPGRAVDARGRAAAARGRRRRGTGQVGTAEAAWSAARAAAHDDAVAQVAASLAAAVEEAERALGAAGTSSKKNKQQQRARDSLAQARAAARQAPRPNGSSARSTTTRRCAQRAPSTTPRAAPRPPPRRP